MSAEQWAEQHLQGGLNRLEQIKHKMQDIV